MGHYGRHIIDPETGLCEICDRGAIYEFRTGKRPAKQFLYSNQDGKFTYRSADEETTPRYVRKPLYPEPPPARTRPMAYSEPIVKKKVPRRNHSPLDDIQHPPHHHGHPATLYYVDNQGSMVPRNEGPPEERPRRYIVQNHQSPPTTRPTRIVQRRAQTPPPPVSEPWRSRSKRQNNSDTEIIPQPHRAQPNDSYQHRSPHNPEMYYIEKSPGTHRSQASHDHNTAPSKTFYQGDTNRKQRQLEPIDRKHYDEPEPTVIKKVYKKLPPSRYEQPEEQYYPIENNLQPTRKAEKMYPSPRTNYPSPRAYDSSPQLTNRYIENAPSHKHPSVYHIDTTNGY